MWLSTNLFGLVVVYTIWTLGVGELFLFAMFWFFITVPKNVKVVHVKVINLQKRLKPWLGEFLLSFSLGLVKTIKQVFASLRVYVLRMWNNSNNISV